MKDFEAYLFVHFIGNQQTTEEEQVYFSLSKNGINWKTLNECKPVLMSDIGDKGIRDPHLVRGKDRFYILATDLSVYNRGLTNAKDCWQKCREEGSRNIIIWESVDLVTWSKARTVELATKESGCCWAPETIYDEVTDSYMVFWASTTPDTGYTDGRMYRSFTKDFITFSEPELYIKKKDRIIDTTFIQDKGVYYRISANNTTGQIMMEYSNSLDNDTFQPLKYTLDGKDPSEFGAFEGPTGCKVNGEEKWCILLDKIGKTQEYYMFETTDFSSGDFKSVDKCTHDVNFRHGTIVPISMDEYDRLLDAYK